MYRFFLGICVVVFASSSLADGPVPKEDMNWYHPDSENLVLMETSKGVMVIELAPEFAPGHVERFRVLAGEGRYDGTEFHRVIDGFMAQGGAIEGGSGLPDLKGEFTFRRDPGKDGLVSRAQEGLEGFVSGFPVASQPDHLVHLTKDGKVESWVRHCPGVISAARTGDPDSANSQFFLMTHTSTWLDRKYTVFGRILVGSSVPGLLNKGEPPQSPDRIIRARLVSRMAEGLRPQIAVMRSDGDAFEERLKQIGDDGGDICAIYSDLVDVRYMIPDAATE